MKGAVFWYEDFRGPPIIKPFSAYHESFLWTLASIHPTNELLQNLSKIAKAVLFYPAGSLLHTSGASVLGVLGQEPNYTLQPNKITESQNYRLLNYIQHNITEV